MTCSNLKEYLWARMWTFLTIVSAILFILLFVSSSFVMKLSSYSNGIRIEKVEAVMVPDNGRKHSFHREEKVTFTYDNGRGRIIKNYDLSFSSNEYFYNQLVKHHRYYVPNGWLILIIILSLIASLTGFLISFEGLSYETYGYYSLEEIVCFRYAIVKQFMSFCGYDGIPKAKESGIYKTLNKRIPTYHSIYRYIKKYMETEGSVDIPEQV